METKEFKIQVPEGYEIDKENSTFERIKFKPIKKAMTYEDVAIELFYMKHANIIGRDGDVQLCCATTKEDASNPIICTSSKQTEKLIAINKLMNVAKYLNLGNEPKGGVRYYFYLRYGVLNSTFTDKDVVDFGVVYFNNKEDLEKAEQILGEETIKTALSTDW